MKFIDFFAGIGTARMGFEKAGHKCVYSVEWDKHKREQYKIIFGKEPEGSDICEVKGTDLPNADVWIAGFPCQDISIAGKTLGFNGNRSSLYFEVLRLLSEVEERNKPCYVLFENVKNFFSVNSGRDFFTALVSLDEIGYDAEWDLLNSKNFGVPQNRERVFIVGHNRNKCSRKVFPIRRESEYAPTQTEELREQVSNTLRTNYGGATSNETYVCEQHLCAITTKEIKDVGKPIAATLCKRDYKGVCNQGIYGVVENEIKELTYKTYVDKRIYDATELDTSCNMGVLSGSRVRKLTPRECMRLQGVDDIVTDKLIKSGISDTQLYRSAGDAMTVNVLYEIAKNMEVY